MNKKFDSVSINVFYSTDLIKDHYDCYEAWLFKRDAFESTCTLISGHNALELALNAINELQSLYPVDKYGMPEIEIHSSYSLTKQPLIQIIDDGVLNWDLVSRDFLREFALRLEEKLRGVYQE